MCFTRRKKKIKSSKIYPEKNVFSQENEQKKNEQKNKEEQGLSLINYQVEEIEDSGKIKCSGCNDFIPLEDIKINCAGCDRFFHCCIAGKCIGENCRGQETILGEKHQLSWCIYCVPGIDQNKVGGQYCICHECYHDSK